MNLSESMQKEFPVLHRAKPIGIQNKQKESSLRIALHLKYLGINFERCEESFYRKYSHLIRRNKGKLRLMKRDVMPRVGRLTVVKILVLKLMYKFIIRIGIKLIGFYSEIYLQT